MKLIIRSARAAMAHPNLFKPFKCKTSKKVYSSEQRDINPVMIADSEFKTIWGAFSPSKFPDFLLSLGTGLSTGSAWVENPIKSSKATRFSIVVKKKEDMLPRFDQQCEQIWNDYFELLESSSVATENHIRLNIKAFELPAVDDTSSVELLRDMVRKQVDATGIRKLASKLIAKLFYFEKGGEIEQTSGKGFYLKGQ